MAEYQQYINAMTGDISPNIIRTRDGMYIPNDPANQDYQEYLKWLAAGNEPDPPATT